MLIDPSLSGIERRQAAAEALIASTVAMAQSGKPLMTRVVPPDDYRVWDHYPPNDAVDRVTRARWFYHAHPPEERGEDEHGHFHLFLEKSMFRGIKPLATPVTDDGAPVVHIAALAVDAMGIPHRLFTVNRWVTDEYLFDADSISARLKRFDLTGAAGGDAEVNRWLTAAVAAFEPEITAILARRDRAIERDRDDFYEDRATEILSVIDVDLQSCITAPERSIAV